MSGWSGNGGTGGSPTLRFLNGGTFLGGLEVGALPFWGRLEEGGKTFPSILGAKFPEGAWDPQLLAQTILAEFAATDWTAHKPRDPAEDEDGLRADVAELLRGRKMRSTRLPEILAQSQGLELYWCHMLMATPASRPATVTLIAAAIAVGQMVGMHWKRHFNRPRPVQVYPAVMPAIPTPPHPAYPSNHSLQSYLIALSFMEVFQGIFGNDADEVYGTALKRLAKRIAENREIAGVHFQSDSTAGEKLAVDIFPLLKATRLFQQALGRAKQEWSGLRRGQEPDAPDADEEQAAPPLVGAGAALAEAPA